MFEVDRPESYSYNWGEIFEYQSRIPRRAHVKCTRCLIIYKGGVAHPKLLHDDFCPNTKDDDYEDDFPSSAGRPAWDNDEDTLHMLPSHPRDSSTTTPSRCHQPGHPRYS